MAESKLDIQPIDIMQLIAAKCEVVKNHMTAAANGSMQCDPDGTVRELARAFGLAEKLKSIADDVRSKAETAEAAE